MNVQINQLVRSLLKKDDIGQCSLQELQQFAERNPHFGAAQLLLTKKLQTEDPALYDEQLQKTFLYFNNPLWVEQVLNSRGSATIIPTEKKIANAPDLLTREPVATELEIENGPNKAEIASQDIEEKIETTDIKILREQEEIPSIAPFTTDNNTQPASAPKEKIEIESQSASPVLEDIATPELAGIDVIVKTELETGKKTVENEVPQMQIPGLKMEAIDPSKAEMVFEPFHTVDYFASQGIKFKEDDKPKDKFGQQLKSFTDWLKSMKRLPVSEIEKVAATVPDASVSEKKVEQLAEHSLTEKEVVTETMAEVWEKQGNTDKATEIYQKLSLLDPSKSLYFAAKISALNKQS